MKTLASIPAVGRHAINYDFYINQAHRLRAESLRTVFTGLNRRLRTHAANPTQAPVHLVRRCEV